MTLERQKIIIRGQVQGVGFRPHVYRTAVALELTGHVCNDTTGVCIEIQGKKLDLFLDNLQNHLPPLAKITDIKTHQITLQPNERTFEIKKSVTEKTGKISTVISPDMCICDACLSELFDPQSRYAHYPFLNCTACGPRLTITKQLPYDRCETSMRHFALCDDCEKEYNNPLNRRYHAQPTACASCGPSLSMTIHEIAEAILQGEIVALKALGGYQLICDAQNEVAVLTLRNRKNREAKPFALMVSDTVIAEKFIDLNASEKLFLESKERPIVLLQKKNAQLPDAIAPDLSHLGIMLPYTPLHYLLFDALSKKRSDSVLVITSANVNGEPIIIDDVEARQSLNTIADKVISYNRYIVTRVDDSVMRVVNHQPLFIRRARGYVPRPIQLPHVIPETIALGGHLKNTFCITRGDEAFVSQHIGSLNNKATIDFFHESLSHLLQFLSVKPERMAHDCHPDFYTTQLAQEHHIPVFAVQHHTAHLASVLAEYHIQEKVLGLVLDGYGYGWDGDAWGGELFLCKNNTFNRLGNLHPLTLLGGDIAAREPWRMGVSTLYDMGKIDDIARKFSHHAETPLMLKLLQQHIGLKKTTSCGRLFDAAAAILNVQSHSSYEGHAAMRLESLVTGLQPLSDGWHVYHNILNFLPTLAKLANMNNPIEGANIFHGTLIAGLTEWLNHNAMRHNVKIVLLSGGCFLNKVLSEGLIKQLNHWGIRALLPKQLPPNDGGISLGQAWIAGNRQICV